MFITDREWRIVEVNRAALELLGYRAEELVGRSAEKCALAAPTDRPSCHTGVVKNVIDITADAASGISYCELLPAGAEREECFRVIR